MTTHQGLDTWHQFVKTKDMQGFSDFIHDEAILHSPVVWTPIKGKFMVTMYLKAASQVIANGHFNYVKETIGHNTAVLEFLTEIDGVTVEGVDIITFANDGKLKEIKVMVRPLKAINIVHEKMSEYLEKNQG